MEEEFPPRDEEMHISNDRAMIYLMCVANLFIQPSDSKSSIGKTPPGGNFNSFYGEFSYVRAWVFV